MSLQAASFGRFAAHLASLSHQIGAAPPAFVLEGGYNLRALAGGVAATIQGVEEGQDAAWEYTGDPRAVEAARNVLAPHWESLR
jgi:acetoin utilization deacetylase AcuC-like enzyme